MIAADPVFQDFERRGMYHLPRIYINDPTFLPKPGRDEEIIVNLQRIIGNYGSSSGILLEFKRIISSRKWNCAWIVLVAFSSYVIKNIFWKNRK